MTTTKKSVRGVSAPVSLVRKSVPRPRTLTASSEDQLYSRQPMEPDVFSAFYGKSAILQPPYPFPNLFLIYEKSDALRWNIAAMRLNVVGFGYTLKFVGLDRIPDTEDDIQGARDLPENTYKKDPKAIAQKRKLEGFLKKVNEEGQTFKRVAKNLWEDYEVTGNAALECVRNQINEVESIYHLPIRYMRKCALPDDPIFVNVSFYRDGKIVELRRKRYFRKYVQQLPKKGQMVYYKEYGDPRIMNATDGEYVVDSNGNYVLDAAQALALKVDDSTFEIASEVLWIQQDLGGEAYGIPRWVGGVSNVLGRSSVAALNYKLSTKGGIPPFLITVNNGTLTEESIRDLKDALATWQTEGTDTWVRGVILESTPESIGLEDKGSSKIEIKWMTDGRKDDIMFDKYGDKTETDIRRCFRISQLYTGGTQDFNRATSISAMRTTEQQVFQPEREDFDEIINTKLFEEGLGITLWSYKSNGPRIVGDEEFRLGFEAFAKYGAITLNDAIDMANAAFGLEMSKYNETWGNYPFMMILELIRQSKLSDLDKITKEDASTDEPVKDVGGGQNPMPLLPVPVGKVETEIDLSKFTEKEIALYQDIKNVQSALEYLQIPHELTDHELKI